MWPVDLAVLADGSLVVAGDQAVHRIGLDGIVTDVAGTNHQQRPSDTPALRTEISPSAVAAMADGGFVLNTFARPRGVLRVWPDQSITSIWRGSWTGPIAALPDGRVLAWTDTPPHTIVEIGHDGLARPFAGSGVGGFSGDGGPATLARLAAPQGIEALPDATVLIADSSNNRVRRVDTRGYIDTIAELPYPWDVAGAPDGGLYVAGSAAEDGTISLYSADGALVHAYPARTFGRPDASEPFRSRPLGWRPLYPEKLAVLPDGNVAFIHNGELWVMAFGPMARLAVSIRNLSIARRKVTATIATTTGGTATLSLRRFNGRGVRVLMTRPLAQGISRLTFRGRLPAGMQTLQVQLRDAARRIASDRVEALLRPWLRMKDGAGAVEAVLDEDNEIYEVTRCRRFSHRRVDCIIRSYEFSPRSCWRVAAVTLRRTGIRTPRLYRCKQGKSPFRKNPWSG